MTTFTINPTYYQVTWTNNSPTDYSTLTNSQSGGLDCTTAQKYNSLVMTTGATAITTTVMSAGQTLLINGYTITFAATDTLTDIINKINLMTKFTNVVADQRVANTYITLANAPQFEGIPFNIAEGNGALARLGLVAGDYRNYPSMLGSTAFSTVSQYSNVIINNVTIQFNSSSNINSAVAQINAYTTQTGVTAEVAGPYLQLESSNAGQPWVINGGNANTSLGFSVGNYGGYPTTLANSQSKERANMRWFQTISQLEQFSTPMFVGNITRTGNIANVATTTFTFTVGYEHPDQISTVALSTEPDSGTVLVGAAAIKRAVARAMTNTWASNRRVFDPTIQAYGPYVNFPNSVRIQNITAQGVDITANILTVSNNITVTQIPGV